MPQCPKCKAEYPPDAEQCLVCRIDLTTDTPSSLPPSQGGPLWGLLQLPLMFVLALASIIGGMAIAGLLETNGIVNDRSKLGQTAEFAVMFTIVAAILFAVGYAAGTRLSRHWIWLGWAIACVPVVFFLMAVSAIGDGPSYGYLDLLFLLIVLAGSPISTTSGGSFKRRRSWLWPLLPIGWAIVCCIVIWLW